MTPEQEIFEQLEFQRLYILKLEENIEMLEFFLSKHFSDFDEYIERTKYKSSPLIPGDFGIDKDGYIILSEKNKHLNVQKPI